MAKSLELPTRQNVAPWKAHINADSAATARLAAPVSAVVVLQSDYNLYYPCTLPGVVTREAIVSGQPLYFWIAFGSLGGIVGAVLG